MKHFDYYVTVPGTHPDTGEKTHPLNTPQGGQPYFDKLRGSGTLEEIAARLKESGHTYELNDWPAGRELKAGDEVAVIKNAAGDVRGSITFVGAVE